MEISFQKPVDSGSAIFDVLYGFVPVTEWEAKIIDSPYFQRLRWIQQLGFSSYIFPGAVHNRFSHVIGVMHSMEQMLRSLGLAVSQRELFDKKCRSDAAMLHRSLRISALLHDIGTFPFSHAIEYAYLKHGNDARATRKQKKGLPNSHEHLGSFIIKNTKSKYGITAILEKYGFDIQFISDIIKGDSPFLIANQLMHSDLDADRMDYLMRDAHYTGIKYGQFDRDFILSNLVPFEAGDKQIGFGVKETAIHAVEDYLVARFNWYSQVIKNSEAAKFDVVSSHLAKHFLEQGHVHQFHDLLTMIEENDERFFWFNDIYFMRRCQYIKTKKLIKNSKISEYLEILLYRRSPKTVKHPHFKHQIIKVPVSEVEKNSYSKKVQKLVDEMQSVLNRHGTGKEWILAELPHKELIFTSSYDSIVKKRTSENIYLERDPIRVVDKDGKPSLLVEKDNTLMKHMSGFANFIPNVYGNEAAIRVLVAQGLIDEQ